MQKKTDQNEDANQLIQEWSKRYKRQLEHGELKEINENLSTFLEVMVKIDAYLSRKVFERRGFGL